MANPLPNEKEIFEKIKKENITVHSLVWDLIAHHIHNDLHMINLILGSTILDGEPFTETDGKKILKHSQEIKSFLDKLYEATKPKS